MLNRWINPLLLITGFLVGYLIAKFFNIPNWSIGQTIDLGDIFSGIVTCYSAYYVAQVIGRDNEINKQAKDLILQRLTQLTVEIDSCLAAVRTGRLDNSSEAASYFKRIRSTAGLIEKVCNDLYKADGQVASKITELNNLINQVYRVMTDTPNVDPATLEEERNKSQVLSDAYTSMLDTNKNLIDSQFNLAKNAIMELQIAIIKHK